ncbi:MAG: hypothetical protein Kow0089_13700 [Desulfobulbaceae bacterium]
MEKEYGVTRNLLLPATVLAAGFFFFCFASLPAFSDTNSDPQYIYTCKCRKNCDCGTVSTSPGTCPCGKKLKENTILNIEGDEAIVCDCGGGCVCDLSDSDPDLCSCGMPVNEVKLSGLYVCACGRGCTCNTVSDKTGNCACGKPLSRVE